VIPTDVRGWGMLDLKPGFGLADTLLRMRLRMIDRLSGESFVRLLDSSKWIEAAGPEAFDSRLWYMAKIPFGSIVFDEAAADLFAAVAGLNGRAKKLVIVDLDDTLWGGVLGDLGWEKLQLGGHDATGEALVDFQRGLQALTRRGVILGIVSKNDEAVALEAIDRHPEMVLRRQDFAGWRINWRDKAANVAELAAELNLGLQSVVFIDDNPVERARVKEALPEVETPDWPSNKLLYPSALARLRCFDTPEVTAEDRERTLLYASERERKTAQTQVGSLDEWIKTIGTKVLFEPLSKMNLQRAVQLLNKTNQMNLATRRMTETELQDWANQPNHQFWTVRVSDKFGDSGLTGLLGMEQDGVTGSVTDFLLSCRVMGRRVEETMLAFIFRQAHVLRLQSVELAYLPTSKNKPCLDWLNRSGLDKISEPPRFSLNPQNDFPYPDGITVEESDYA
jgi:FkbH-like protein